jgi:Anti-sigma factor NepR
MSDELKPQPSASPVRPARATGAKKRGQSRDMTNLPTSISETDEPILGQDIQSHLGRTLKASYQEMIRQPVPDKFHQLLKELERREKN